MTPRLPSAPIDFSPEPELRRDQLQAIDFVTSRDASLLLSEPGCGKTGVLLGAVEVVCLLEGGSAMVMVPPGLIAQFRAEAAIWSPGLPDPLVNRVPAPGQWALVAHSRAHLLVDEVRRDGLNFLLVDEAHLASTIVPKPTRVQRAVHALADEAGGVVLATATPVDCVAATDLIGLISTSGLISRRHVEAVLAEVEFAEFRPGERQPRWISDRGIGWLGSLLATGSVRMRANDLGVDLPEVDTSHIRVPLGRRQLAQQAAAERFSGLRRAQLRDRASLILRVSPRPSCSGTSARVSATSTSLC